MLIIEKEVCASIATNLGTYPGIARRRRMELESLAMERTRYAAKRLKMKLPKEARARSWRLKTPTKNLRKKKCRSTGLGGLECRKERQRIFEEEVCRNVSTLCICTRCSTCRNEKGNASPHYPSPYRAQENHCNHRPARHRGDGNIHQPALHPAAQHPYLPPHETFQHTRRQRNNRV